MLPAIVTQHLAQPIEYDKNPHPDCQLDEEDLPQPWFRLKSQLLHCSTQLKHVVLHISDLSTLIDELNREHTEVRSNQCDDVG